MDEYPLSDVPNDPLAIRVDTLIRCASAADTTNDKALKAAMKAAAAALAQSVIEMAIPPVVMAAPRVVSINGTAL